MPLFELELAAGCPSSQIEAKAFSGLACSFDAWPPQQLVQFSGAVENPLKGTLSSQSQFLAPVPPSLTAGPPPLPPGD